jgi:hypothetical protein
MSFFSPKDVPGISGTVEFAERVNQTTLVTIKLMVLCRRKSPAHIMRIILLQQVISFWSTNKENTGISKRKYRLWAVQSPTLSFNS